MSRIKKVLLGVVFIAVIGGIVFQAYTIYKMNEAIVEMQKNWTAVIHYGDTFPKAIVGALTEYQKANTTAPAEISK